MPRTIYIVRHCERIDNIDPRWRKKHPSFEEDNSPLSSRGRNVQAKELQKRFENIHLDHVFASPFDRTMETSSILIGNKDILIKPDPGLLEALYLCENPPSFWKVDKLKEKFPNTDTKYVPVFKTCPKEGGYGDEGCLPRVKKFIETVLDTVCVGENDTIVFVSHGSPIAAAHDHLARKWKYVGQATVSTFTEVGNMTGKFTMDSSNDASHMSDKSDLRAY
uniref:Phosphoglycerate mutase family protein n=1 Tax=Rhabditophanes sp. KR3021 TaxID=114890 RepID=A0AC35U0A5_9BILA